MVDLVGDDVTPTCEWRGSEKRGSEKKPGLIVDDALHQVAECIFGDSKMVDDTIHMGEKVLKSHTIGKIACVVPGFSLFL